MVDDSLFYILRPTFQKAVYIIMLSTVHMQKSGPNLSPLSLENESQVFTKRRHPLPQAISFSLDSSSDLCFLPTEGWVCIFTEWREAVVDEADGISSYLAWLRGEGGGTSVERVFSLIHHINTRHGFHARLYTMHSSIHCKDLYQARLYVMHGSIQCPALR